MTMVLPKRNDEGAELREAASTLKGMLGIGTASKSQELIPVVTEEVRGSSVAVADSKASVKKNKKKKKGKQQVVEAGVTVVSQSKPPKPSQGPSKKGQKKDKKKNSNPNSNGNSSKYAWSAFQASPDASSLPLPVFQEDESSKTDLRSDIVSQEEQKSDKGKVISKSKPNPTNNSNKTNKKKTIVSEGSMLNDDLLNKLLSTEDEDSSSRIDTKCAKEEVRDLSLEVEEKLKVNDELNIGTSSSGVNLAAALLEPSTPLKANTQPSAPQPFVSQHPYPQSPPSLGHMMPNMGHPYGPSPPPLHHQQMITIQVQVPENNGYMMVNTPAGFPIPVQVPPGVRPGMIIPVNVPMPPNVPMSPPGGGHMPIPMNGHYQYSQPMMPPQYPPHQTTNVPRPGSWAAAASKSQENNK